MPPEWELHEATWMGWPADDELWFGHLSGVRNEYAALARTIARFERVEMLVRDEESERDARARLDGANVRFHRVPLDDSWLRDSGPLFLTRGEKEREVALVNWRFNAWGGKFEWENDDRIPEYVAEVLGMAHWDRPEVLEGGSLEIAGGGAALTTRSCFLTDTRNPGLTEEGYIRQQVCLLDSRKIGLGVTVFVSVRTSHHDLAWLRKFAAGVRDMPEVTEFYRMSGNTDYLIKVVVPDIAGFDRVYKKLIQVAELFDVSSSFAMEEIKYTTALPLDYA
jgi:DNA-binding Lrp family transcriptional regulator